MKSIIGIIILAVICFIIVVIVSANGLIRRQINKLSKLSFEELITYTTRNRKDAVITIGLLKDGHSTYKVYGNNGSELPRELHTYEIGSITKTFTAALLREASKDNLIDLNAPLNQYLDLEAGTYATISDIATHTSGFKSFYLEGIMLHNKLKRRNDFYGVSSNMILRKIPKNNKHKSYNFKYSNFGYAVLGIILEKIYNKSYRQLMNAYIQKLGLTNTKISEMDGDLDNYWKWGINDAYLSAGAITSNITDMLKYAQIQLDNRDYKTIQKINASNTNLKLMDINLDEIGMAWIKDSRNNIIWHNGGTGNYNSYLGLNYETNSAVVVLSNLSPYSRVPGTIFGLKFLKCEYTL